MKNSYQMGSLNTKTIHQNIGILGSISKVILAIRWNWRFFASKSFLTAAANVQSPKLSMSTSLYPCDFKSTPRYKHDNIGLFGKISNIILAMRRKWKRCTFDPLLAPQSGALRISGYRDFHPIPSHTHPILPLIAFEHLSFSIVI